VEKVQRTRIVEVLLQLRQRVGGSRAA
jgi:hypothetical protein